MLEALTIPTLAAPPTAYACIEMCRTLMAIFKMEDKVKKKSNLIFMKIVQLIYQLIESGKNFAVTYCR